LPAVCVVAAMASGTTRLRAGDGATETLAATATALRAFGVECVVESDGVTIRGPRPGLVATIAPADVDSGGDARVAMAACVLALAASGPSRVRNAGAIATRFPKFVATLRALGASIDVEAG
jgi:3-phosphoshikimate 1-carboxyvinyltransferase